MCYLSMFKDVILCICFILVFSTASHFRFYLILQTGVKSSCWPYFYDLIVNQMFANFISTCRMNIASYPCLTLWCCLIQCPNCLERLCQSKMMTSQPWYIQNINRSRNKLLYWIPQTVTFEYNSSDHSDNVVFNAIYLLHNCNI